LKSGRATGRRARALLLALAVTAPALALGHGPPGAGERLPVVGPAPAFTLTTHAGGRLSLAELRGKVLAVTFIYATCKDSCPVLTSKLVALQHKLGPDFGSRVRFVAISVDPVVDTPEVLRGYAEAVSADSKGWSFLTGTPEEIRKVVSDYGGFARRTQRGDVDHLYITSLVDRRGAIRVQYLGYRFDSGEMLRDLRSLLAE
jgi:protein SCO1/2